MGSIGMDRFVEYAVRDELRSEPLCLCPASSEYDPPCPAHGVLGIGVTGSTPAPAPPCAVDGCGVHLGEACARGEMRFETCPHREALAHSPPTVIVFRPDGSEDIGRVVASHVSLPDGLRAAASGAAS